MKIKIFITAVIFLFGGIFIGAYATREVVARMMKQNLYTSSASQASSYLALLKMQSSGDQIKLTSTLENLLSINLLVLNDCVKKYCQSHDMPGVEKVIQKAREYKFKHVKPTGAATLAPLRSAESP